MTVAVKGVSMMPGEMQFTRMPSDASSTARQRVNCSTPALLAEYAARIGHTRCAQIEPMFTVHPRRRGSIRLATSTEHT